MGWFSSNNDSTSDQDEADQDDWRGCNNCQGETCPTCNHSCPGC